jgi:hypothetical protein
MAKACSVASAVHRDLADLPDELATSTDAVLALTLAEALDNQIGGAAASKELRAILASLKSQVESQGAQGDDLDDIAARRAARLAAAQAG